MSLAAHARTLAACAVLAACGSKPTAVAELLEGQGAVDREHGGAFASAPNGQPFFIGDAARTGGGAWARIRLRDRAVVRLGPDTLIRFVAGGARLESGAATAEAAAVTISTEAGLAQIEPGGVLRAIGAEGGTRYQVDIGRAVIQGAAGPVTLEAGAAVVVAIGGAIIAPAAPPPPPLDAGVAVDAAPPPPPVVDSVALTVKGKGVTSKSGADPWRPLAAGAADVPVGATVKLPRGASIEVARGDDRATVTGPAEVTVGGGEGPLLTARSGAARVAARTADLAVAVPGGVVVTHPGGDAELTIGRRDTVTRVERGEVALDGTTSDAVARAGETGVIGKDGAATVRDLVPSTIDVALPTGESAVIHDPGRKVAVRVEFGALCPDGGVLELGDGRRRIGGATGAAFFAGAGATRYRVRCDGGGVVKTGSVRIAGDTGAAPVVRTPGTNPIETDGRKNLVTYQNRVPTLSIFWGEAKGASTLHVLAGTNERTFEASGSHTLASGTLAEGSYTIWITAGTRSSPRTPLRIAFDNAAPTAQITAPAPRAAWGDPLEVTGVTVEGWSVAVDGKAAERDGSGRFRAEVATAGKTTVAVRLAHPKHGVHYYLRRRN